MDRRHSDLLNSRLEEILTNGCTYISWNELYLWYGVHKLAAKSYRDLEERWEEISTGRTMRNGEPLGSLHFVQAPIMRNTPGAYFFGADMVQVLTDEE